MSNILIRRETDRASETTGLHTALHSRDRDHVSRPEPFCAALIALCFLLSSTAWLAWEYHLMEQTTHLVSDMMTMVAGYLLQAVGIALFALMLRKGERKAMMLTPFALILHTLCLIPAMMSQSFAGTLVSGLVMNVFCGYLAGLYLYVLTRTVPKRRRATVVGIGYILSILGSWLLPKLFGTDFYYSSFPWIICLLLTCVILFMLQLRHPLTADAAEQEQAAQLKAPAAGRGPKTMILTAGAVVMLFSIVNNCSFAFSSSDLVKGISVESSRLFYGVGLLIAGLVSDRDRKYGAIAALSALITPFMMLALRHEPLSLTVFWALNYFAFGFYAVFRMIVFTDLSDKTGLVFLAPFGLLIGKAGDAAGEAACLTLSSTPLIFLAALVSVSAIFLFFRVYRSLYMPEEARQQTEQDRFYLFATQHDLSSRERDILRLVLEEKTNSEIADDLSISENTVKFHIRNLLQKTGCKSKNDLIHVYTTSRD